MNIEQFRSQLPTHFDNFLAPAAFSHPMYEYRVNIPYPFGATTPFVGHLLNYAVSLLPPHEAHLHIGVYCGLSLSYAMTGNFDKIHYANDDFSHAPGIREEFYGWMGNYGFMPYVKFQEGDCFEMLRMNPPFIQHQIGVYFYDAGHTYENQLNGLRLAEPYLADEALIIIDDTNWDEPAGANRDWIAENPHAFMMFDLPTPGNCHPTWWNGIQVIGYRRR